MPCCNRGNSKYDQAVKDYEENVQVLGYFCGTCNKDWVLDDWKGNRVPNDVKRCLTVYHQNNSGRKCIVTTKESDDFIKYVCESCGCGWRLQNHGQNETQDNVETIGYICSVCKKEWLNDDWKKRIRREENMERITSLTSGQEVNMREPFEVNCFICETCQREWLLKSVILQEDPQEQRHLLKEALKRHHKKVSCCEEPRFEFKQDVFVKEYYCASTKQRWLLKRFGQGNEICRRVRDMKAIRDHHHETGCPGGIRSLVQHREDNVNPEDPGVFDPVGIGFYCSHCKKEWLLETWNRNPAPNVAEKAVDHHYVPRFRYLQVSDTGNMVDWDTVVGSLKQGDHIAWNRFDLYWHHAIVENVRNSEIDVIEWNANSQWCKCTPIISRKRHKKSLFSTLYKVHYPEEVESQNPPDLVLSRARSRLSDTGYTIEHDNCEHFATFCKTGNHKCNQVPQMMRILKAWGIKRLFIVAAYITLLVGFAEMIERIWAKGRDLIGVLIIGSVEVVHLVTCKVYGLFCKDRPRENFTRAKNNCRCRCSGSSACAFVKLLIKLFCFMGLIVISVFVTKTTVKHSWERGFKVLYEILLGVGFGLVGNLIGVFITYCLPHFWNCCCMSLYLRAWRFEKKLIIIPPCIFILVFSAEMIESFLAQGRDSIGLIIIAIGGCVLAVAFVVYKVRCSLRENVNIRNKCCRWLRAFICASFEEVIISGCFMVFIWASMSIVRKTEKSGWNKYAEVFYEISLEVVLGLVGYLFGTGLTYCLSKMWNCCCSDRSRQHESRQMLVYTRQLCLEQEGTYRH